MVSIATLAAFDLVTGTAASLGLAYLLYSRRVVVSYPRFFKLTLLGLLIYAVTGPVIGMVAPSFVHAVHGVAALGVTVGLYGLVSRRLEADDGDSSFGMSGIGTAEEE